MASRSDKRKGRGRKANRKAPKARAKVAKRITSKEVDFFGRPRKPEKAKPSRKPKAKPAKKAKPKAPRASRKLSERLSRAMGQPTPYGRPFKLPTTAPPELTGIQQARLLANKLRAKLRSKRTPAKKLPEIRQALRETEEYVRLLTGPDPYVHSQPGLPMGPGMVPMGKWSFSTTSHEEIKRFRSGDALLGYIENRPGVVGILGLEGAGDSRPGGGGGRSEGGRGWEDDDDGARDEPTRPRDSAVGDRIDHLPMVENAPPSERGQLREWLWDAYEWCEMEAIWAEFEVDFDSGAATE